MSDRLLALEDLTHDGDIIPKAIVGPTPRLPIPSLNDLRPGHAEPGNESVSASERIDSSSTHGCIRRRPSGKLHHACAEADAFRYCRDIGERADCIRAIRLRGPH